MSEWSQLELGAVASIVRRGTAPTYVVSSDVFAIGQRCVRNEGFRPDAARPHDARIPVPVTPELGDVLINSTGTGTIGRSCVYREPTRRYMVDGHVTVVRLLADKADSRVINEIIRSPAGQQYLESHCYTGSTNQIELSQAALSRMPLTLPPLAEQRRIAEILDTIDDTIRATERIIAKLDLVDKGILRRELTALCTARMVLVEQRVTEVTVGIVVRPTQYYAESGVPILRSANVRETGLDLSDLAFMSPSTHARMVKTAVGPSDVLTVRTGYPGTTAVVPSTLQTANSVDVVITRTDDRVDPEFLALWVNSDFGKGHVLARQGGLAQQHFNVADMKAMPIPDVDHAAQQRVVALNRELRTRLHRELAYVVKLRRVRFGLAADLLSGRVRTVAV